MQLTQYKKYIGAALLCLWLSSCSKDFLNVQPNNFIPEERFYKTDEDAIQAVTAAYQPLQVIYNGAAWHLGDIMSDDTDLGGGGGGDGLEAAELDNFSVTPFNPVVSLMWKQCYIGIFRSNLVINKIPTITTISEPIRKRTVGEAHFLRAYYYYQLVRLFGKVPLITTVLTDAESRQVERAEINQVYDLIKQDLTQAATELPASYGGDDLGRATWGAAKGMLASVYLTLKDKPNAAATARQVIDAGTYHLNDTYGWNFDLLHENSDESLFEVQYRNGGEQWSDNGPGQKMNCFFAPRDQNIVQSEGYGWNIPTEDLVSKFERDGSGNIKDKRRPASMWMPGDKLGSYTQPDNLVGSPRGYNIRKYFVPASNTSGDGGGWSCALNVPIMRYSEVLLIYAEAAGPGAGKPYADEVRARAGLDPLPAGLSDAAYLERIYVERRVEFAFEMHRWYDLLRHPDPNYFINVMKASGKTNITAKHRFMPIPQGERDVNSRLTQNDGY